jgi:cellulose synthase/poly-beta-1,6-N-acetylglucosamine synthase-like glycosyltransferase
LPSPLIAPSVFLSFLTQVLFSGLLVVLAGSAIVTAAFLLRERRRRPISRRFLPPASVVIPAYNEAHGIVRCLEALRAGGYPVERLDIMVVDDGSTDGTRGIVGACAGVRLLRQDHAGKVAALNTGLRHATHEFLLAIDADTLLAPGAIAAVVQPLADPRVAAVTGIVKVANPRGVLGWFQSVEYLANALLRESFAGLFRCAPGLSGALTCYRRSALERIGGFKPDTAAEDFDVALDLVSRGFSVVAARGAVGYTYVPLTLSELLRQRLRWMKGVMQCLVKHRALLISGRPAAAYLVASQGFWIVYALASLPLLAYHFLLWLPQYSTSLLGLGLYVLRWASAVGPMYMVLKIPEWGINLYFAGAVAGLLSPVVMLVALRRYDLLRVPAVLAILCYFPYTLLLSGMMFGTLAAYLRTGGRGAFVK